MSDPVFKYSRPGFSLTVYPNRIDVKEGTFLKKSVTHPLSRVTTVEGGRMAHKLIVVTADGKRNEYNLGTKRDEALQAILDNL